MKWIALTGGIACGKSTVSQLLRSKSVPVIDADEIAREVLQKDSSGLKLVVESFGEEVLLEDGTLDRRKLGQRVFGHPDMLHKLESITHPLIRAETARRRDALEKKGEPLAIYDIPLLFETKAQSQFDAVIVVTCTKHQQKERLRRRTNLSDDEIEMRIASQLPLSLKEQEAQFVLHNDRDESHLLQEVGRLVKWLEELKK